MNINWANSDAAIWRPQQQRLRAVIRTDPIQLDSLLGIERQKTLLQQNTEAFLHHAPSNNALLWGARGCGKSSLIKALLNHYRHLGLRVIQVETQDLVQLPEIVDTIEREPYHFIIYADDLSFERGDGGYRALKSVLEGSIEVPPEHVRVYATSNRRHLLPEQMADNRDSQLVNGEIHHNDTIEERISLSDRFGLSLSFYPLDQPTYLEIIDSLFNDYQGDRSELHRLALRFTLERGNKSGRTARNFYNSLNAQPRH
ncbi:MAG: ATP-binding protein [Gammaproteobacteria bacterium]|nr:ATP-binding protein [Gammaproteobacteria bacterium]